MVLRQVQEGGDPDLGHYGQCRPLANYQPPEHGGNRIATDALTLPGSPALEIGQSVRVASCNCDGRGFGFLRVRWLVISPRVDIVRSVQVWISTLLHLRRTIRRGTTYWGVVKVRCPVVSYTCPLRFPQVTAVNRVHPIVRVTLSGERCSVFVEPTTGYPV